MQWNDCLFFANVGRQHLEVTDLCLFSTERGVNDLYTCGNQSTGSQWNNTQGKAVSLCFCVWYDNNSNARKTFHTTTKSPIRHKLSTINKVATVTVGQVPFDVDTRPLGEIWFWTESASDHSSHKPTMKWRHACRAVSCLFREGRVMLIASESQMHWRVSIMCKIELKNN